MKKLIYLALILHLLLAAAIHAETGSDIREAFGNARDGKSLCCVFLGGSITQSGEGWIGDWLSQQFPKSRVTIVNCGMSATGSDLGIFRLERDVISFQPDLVAIEYCVNDGGQTDEDTIRNMESIIVRLKQMPSPPAIIILEAASQAGVNLGRHRRVAQHYGLIEVDIQKAVDDRLQKTGKRWETYFRDKVHPNDTGNKLYSEIIAETLTPFATDTGKPSKKKVVLPPALSTKPLLLNARMVPLTNFVNDWKRENTLPFWWDRFFCGVLTADKPGSTLTIPVRGTAIGLFYAMDKSYGTFFASVDEGFPIHIETNSRGGYSSCIVGKDLAPVEHRLTVALPSPANSQWDYRLNGPVNLGYILIAGEGSKIQAATGQFPPDRLAQLHFKSILNTQWKWSGPYASPSTGGMQVSGILERMANTFAPEEKDAKVDWKIPDQPEGIELDFRKLTGTTKQEAIYALTTIPSNREREVILAISCDYYIKLWLNGTLVTSILEPHSGPSSKILIPVHLKAGDNLLLIKLGAGTGGFTLSAGIFE